MADSKASEFTPLLLTSEPATDSVEQTTSNGHNYQTHESQSSNGVSVIPLLPESTQRPTTFVHRGSSNGLLRSRTQDTTGSAAVEDRDHDRHMLRNRSRLNSYPVLPEPEDIKKAYDATASALGIDKLLRIASDALEGHENEASGDENEAKPESKYMIVSTTRFWFVFMTIMLCTFARIELIRPHAISD